MFARLPRQINCKNASTHPRRGYCDVSPHHQQNTGMSPPLMTLRCVLSHPHDTAMCHPPPSRCCYVYSPTLRLRMMRCVLPHAEVTEQAALVKKVDLPLPPPEEVVVHTVQEEAANHHPSLHTHGDFSTTRMLPPTQDPDTAMCPLPTHRTLECVTHLQNTAVFFPSLRCCDVSSSTFFILKCVLPHPHIAVTCCSNGLRTP